MLETLALFLTAALPAPLPMVAPTGCRVDATLTELVVKSGGTEARYPWTEREVPFAPGESGPPQVTTLPLPGGKDLLLASVRESWSGVAPAGLGYLYEVTCGAAPAIRVALTAPGVDFGRVAIARDGRWIVGGWGGLRVLDPNTLRLTPLTSPAPYPVPACWTAEEGKPARAADVPVVGGDGIARSPTEGPEEIRFTRGGACGYEAEMTTTAHALLLDRGIVRRIASVTTLAFTDEGHLLVGDGAGPCEQQSASTLWESADGATWRAVALRDKGAAGIARVVHLPGRLWLALTAICDTGGGAVGGDLLASNDLATWEPLAALPEGFNMTVSGGGGIVELLVDGERAYLASEQGKVLRWFESSDGREWQPSAKRQVRVAQGLAKTLGVGAINGLTDSAAARYAWTSDGLFMKPKAEDATPWTRIFPR